MCTMSSVLSIHDGSHTSVQLDPLADPKPVRSRIFNIRSGGTHIDDDPKHTEVQVLIYMRTSGSDKGEVAFTADNILRTVGTHIGLFCESKIQDSISTTAVADLRTRNLPPAQMRVLAWKTWEEPTVRQMPLPATAMQTTGTRYCIYALLEVQIFLAKSFLELVGRLSGVPNITVSKINWRTPQTEHDELIQAARKMAFKRAGAAAVGYVKQMKMEAGVLNVVSIKDLITPTSAHVSKTVDSIAVNESRVETEVQLEVVFRVVAAEDVVENGDQHSNHSDMAIERANIQVGTATNRQP